MGGGGGGGGGGLGVKWHAPLRGVCVWSCKYPVQGSTRPIPQQIWQGGEGGGGGGGESKQCHRGGWWSRLLTSELDHVWWAWLDMCILLCQLHVC